MRRSLVLPLVLALSFVGTPAAAAPPYSATYTVPSVQPSVGTSQQLSVQVILLNTGSETWNATPPFQVNLSYHWFDQAGRAVIWDGARTPLPANVPATGTIATTAQVTAPAQAGAYHLRFALVKEGVAWFDQEPNAHLVTVVSAFSASFGATQLPALVAGGTYGVNVPVTNAGTAPWNGAAPNPVNLSYHWLDQAGRAAVWDGVRTSIGADLPIGQTRVVAATVVAPAVPGSYSLAIDMVREGIGWFGQSSTVAAAVQAATYRATYSVGAGATAFIAESQKLNVTVTNVGNVPWSSQGTNPVNLSYHWYDAAGSGLVVWDGARTALPAIVQPGASQSVQLGVSMPTRPGTYTLRIDLVREGFGWFSTGGSPTATVPYQVTSGLGASWGGVEAPASITNGSGFPARVTVQNTGQRTWSAAGSTPVRLSYHIHKPDGALVVWDGVRGILPKDVAPGESVTVSIAPVAPASTGTYSIRWDMVQEGVAWFSSYGLATKASSLDVFPGVTIYGKGWGHGVGMSQWGAQGWATGVAGAPLTGEQIVLKYYPGAVLSPVPAKPIKVLLSSPSSGCNARTVYDIAQLRSDGGIKVVKWWNPSQVILNAVGSQTVRVFMSGNTIRVMDEWSAKILYSGTETIGLVPGDPTKPITLVQKGRFYRGLLAIEPAGFQALRVVNELGWDDYAKGSVPAEMLVGWHVEAYKAQAYAAKSYAAWRQSSNTSRLWDVRDDTSDQCYGGASVETTITDQAVAATSGRIITHGGAPVKAYYSSSDGGATEPNGCVFNVRRDAAGRYSCGGSEAYLQAVPDPADGAAVGPSGANPHRSWVVTFSSARVESAVRAAGYNIGAFISMDLTNVGPGGHVVSVRVRGTFGTVELAGDSFLRSRLGLKSTMARTSPF